MDLSCVLFPDHEGVIRKLSMEPAITRMIQMKRTLRHEGSILCPFHTVVTPLVLLPYLIIVGSMGPH